MPTVQQARQWYAQDDPVHGLDHVLRVLRLAQAVGTELGADLEILEAAALLHDAAGSHPASGVGRREHQLNSAAFAEQVLSEEGWPSERIERVAHCIRAHRFRGEEQPASLEAQILFDCDKLDVIGAFGVARTIGYAIQAGQPIYSKPSRLFQQNGQRGEGEPHSAYHEYLFKLRKVRDRLHTDPAQRMAEERERLLTSFFEQLQQEAEFQGG